MSANWVTSKCNRCSMEVVSSNIASLNREKIVISSIGNIPNPQLSSQFEVLFIFNMD